MKRNAVNERIKDFIDQATTVDNDGFRYFDKKKFAELIREKYGNTQYPFHILLEKAYKYKVKHGLKDEELNELDYTGGVGMHEFMVFFQKATKEDEEQMNDCLKTNNVPCVKSLIQKVTGMSMDKINEGFYDDKEADEAVGVIKKAAATYGIKFSDPGYITVSGGPDKWIK